ncbi:MAG: aldehyde dehydrogenase family protein [Opitutaceae bacterium]
MPQSGLPLTGFVAGSWLSAGERLVARENPGRSDEIAVTWCPAAPEDALSAMAAAASAFPAWASRPLSQRAALLEELTEQVARSAESFALCISRENGKTLAEARSEVAAGLRDARHLLAQARQDGAADVVSAAGSQIHSMVASEPVGVFLVVTPWNFPLVHVNLHTAYREPELPVSAWRDSGRGIPECGRFAREFFTRARTIYVQQQP